MDQPLRLVPEILTIRSVCRIGGTSVLTGKTVIQMPVISAKRVLPKEQHSFMSAKLSVPCICHASSSGRQGKTHVTSVKFVQSAQRWILALFVTKSWFHRMDQPQLFLTPETPTILDVCRIGGTNVLTGKTVTRKPAISAKRALPKEQHSRTNAKASVPCTKHATNNGRRKIPTKGIKSARSAQQKTLAIYVTKVCGHRMDQPQLFPLDSPTIPYVCRTGRMIILTKLTRIHNVAHSAKRLLQEERPNSIVCLSIHTMLLATNSGRTRETRLIRPSALFAQQQILAHFAAKVSRCRTDPSQLPNLETPITQNV